MLVPEEEVDSAEEDVVVIDVSSYVTVTAAKEAQTIAEAPSIITVVTRAQIEQHSYRSIAEAISSLPGMYVNTDYVFHDVGVRGISGELRGSSRLIKFMINGHSVSNRSDTTNFIGPELIPMAAVQQIEVIRGPGSALYGANAFLGVVNIITRKGAEVKGGELSLSGTVFRNNVGGDFGAMVAQQMGAVDFLFAVSGGHENRSGQSIECTTHLSSEEPCSNLTSVTSNLLGRQSEEDISRPFSLFSSVDLDIGKLFGSEDSYGNLNIMGNLQMLDSSGSFSDWATLNYDVEGNQGNQDPHSSNQVALQNGFIRGAYDLPLFDDMLNLNLKLAYAKGWPSHSERLKQTTGYLTRAGIGSDSFDLGGEIRISPYSAPKDFILNKLSFLVGADYTMDRVSFVLDQTTVPMGYDTAKLGNTGIFAQANATMLDNRVRLIGGLRYDFHRGGVLDGATVAGMSAEEQDNLCNGDQVCYNQLSYRIGATWLVLRNAVGLGESNGKETYLINEIFLKVLYGTAFKAPSPAFLYGVGYIGDRPVNPNPGLVPQTVSSLEVQAGASLWEKHLYLSLIFFNNQLNKKAEFSREGALGVTATNGADSSTWGLEGVLNFNYHPFSVYTNFSLQNSERDLADNPLERLTDVFGYPDMMSTSGLSVIIPVVKLMASVELEYIGKRVGHPINRSDRESEKYTLAPYALLNFYLVTHRLKLWEDKETRIAFRVTNLAGTKFSYPGFQPYYRYDVPGTPRTMLLNLTQEF